MFNTLLYAKKLEAAGLSREQAEAQVTVMTEMVVDGVATKQDLSLLGHEVNQLRQEMQQDLAHIHQDFKQLRQEMQQELAHIRQDFKQLRQEVQQDFMKFRHETQQEFSSVRREMVELESRLTLRLGLMMASCMSLMTAIFAWLR